jgi:hypothetical protein
MERYVQDEANEVQFSLNRVDGSIRGPSINEAAESQNPIDILRSKQKEK